jgi:pimeloyl-ACP methyl ester carboxylesterase
VDEHFCHSGELTICHQTFGDPADPTVLLVMGLGTQMIGWNVDFCEELAGRGFHVVRYDNRDVGRSSRVDAPPPTIGQLLLRSKRAAAYTLADMAGDGIAVLDFLGVRSAHVVGASMGGMIAQSMALHYPDRVRSLVSIMSNTGSRFAGQPHVALYPVLLRPAPREREKFIDHVEKTFGVIGSPGFDRDPEQLRELAGQSYDRGVDRAGGMRQLAAIVASGDRTRDLKNISVPTVVIHGKQDRLVRPSGGRATAKAIPGARLVEIDGMGHDLPRGAWSRIIDAIVENAQRAAADEPGRAVPGDGDAANGRARLRAGHP